MERIPMTPEGFARLKDELKNLKSNVRSQNMKDLEEARSHGDLSENAEYHAAKEKQGIISAQIIDLEDKVSRVEVIDPVSIKAGDKIVFGAKVRLYDINTKEETEYQIVGDFETDVKLNRIGISSPIARGMLGRIAGDEIFVNTPKGRREFEIVSVTYG